MQKKIQGLKRPHDFEDSYYSDDILGIESHCDSIKATKLDQVTKEDKGVITDEGGQNSIHNDTSKSEEQTNMRSESASESRIRHAKEGAPVFQRIDARAVMSPSIHSDDFQSGSAFREVGARQGRGTDDTHFRGDIVCNDKLCQDHEHCVGKYSRQSRPVPILSNYSYRSSAPVTGMSSKADAFPGYNPVISDTARWQQTASSMAAAAYYAPYHAYYQHLSHKLNDNLTLGAERYMYMDRWLSRANYNRVALRYAMDKSTLSLNPSVSSRQYELLAPQAPMSTQPPHRPESTGHLHQAWPRQMVSGSVFPLPSSATFELPPENWCAKCNASFRMTSDLVYHMRTHHKRNPDPENSVKTKRDDKLQCNVCNETFRERHHLTRHMTSHVNG